MIYSSSQFSFRKTTASPNAFNHNARTYICNISRHLPLPAFNTFAIYPDPFYKIKYSRIGQAKVAHIPAYIGECNLKKRKDILDISSALAIFLVPIDPVRHLYLYRCAPKKEEPSYRAQVGFQDSYPLHIMSLACIYELFSHFALGAPPLIVLRFRPNITITGPEAYDGNDWKMIKIGNKL